MRRVKIADYDTRTCNRCALYVPVTARLNTVEVAQPWGTISEDDDDGFCGTAESRICDKCHFAARLEGAL